MRNMKSWIAVALMSVSMLVAGGVAWGQHNTKIDTHDKAIEYNQKRIERMERVYVEQNGMLREIHGMLKRGGRR